VRTQGLVQALIVLVVAVGLGFLVASVAKGWAGWVVFGVIVMAALGGAIAIWQRQYPAPTKKRTFRRDSESRW
jgi:hypothetical protein